MAGEVENDAVVADEAKNAEVGAEACTEEKAKINTENNTENK